jgi:rod shape determining protein RodA
MGGIRLLRGDLSLPIVISFILVVGMTTLSTAAPNNEFGRQLIFLAVSLALCAGVVWIGRRRLMRYAFPIYGLTIGLLLLTQFLGTEINGARSWLYIGPLPGFQPSELAKLSLPLALAIILHERPIRGLLDYLRPLVLIGVPFMLVFLEPDLGSALVLAAIGGGVLLVRGIPWRHLLIFVALFVVAVPTVVWPNLKDHQKDRLVIFLNPAADPQGSGYQVIQSTIAVGSGGLLGKGYRQGTQSQLGFIPQRQADFIFPVLAEEGGFVSAALLLILYGLLFWRLVSMAGECPYERDQLVIVGVLSFVSFQVIVNIGVSLGLAPVTGITLPLVSYGGTSLVSTMIALSLAFVIHRDRYADW